MRHSLAILLAAATALSAASFVPAKAAPIGPAPVTATSLQDGIEQVTERRHRDRWRHGDGWRDGDRRRHRRHRRDFSPNQFYFGFGFPYYGPQAYYYRRPYQPYYGYGDCFRTWDGQLVCR